MNPFSPQSHLAVQVVFNQYIMKTEIVKRTWKERLFGWPWRPWIKTKSAHVPGMYMIGDVIYAHPALRSQIENELNKSR